MATPFLSETSTNTSDMEGINRAVAYMSDGTAILVTHRTGAGIRIYDNHSGSFADYFAFTDDIIGGEYLSLTIDADDHLHLVYTSVSGNVRYVKFTYGGSYAWTAGSSELVRTKPGTSSIGRKDVEVLDDGVIVVAWLESDNATTSRVPTARFRVRHTGGSWGGTYVITEATAGSVATGRCLSIARDDDTDVDSDGYQRIAYAYSMPNSVGGKFGHLRIKLDDGGVDEQAQIATFGQQGLGSYGHVYSHGDGEWTFVGQQNHAAGLNLCQTIYMRWKYGVGFIEQASPLAQIDATWPDVNATWPTTALVGEKAVLITTFVLSGRVALVARVYHPGVGWGPQFNLAEGSAFTGSSGVGSEFMRSSANRNVPTDRILVGSAMARLDSSSSITRAHYAHTNPAPAAPTNLSPGIDTGSPAAAPVTATSEPVLSARTGVVSSGPVRRRVEWLADTSTLFGTDPRTYIQTTAELQYSGSTHSKLVPNTDPLYSEDWFVKARAIDEFGRVGSWSSVFKFVVFHPPATTDWNPANGKLTGYGSGDVLLKWRFTDPYPNDSQSAYRITVTLESDGTVLLDTGKVTSTDNEAVVNIDSAYKDESLLWRVDVWDVDDSLSPNVTYSLFVLGDEPSVTVDSPVDATTLTAPLLNVEWTATFGGGRTQAAFRVDVQDVTTSTTVHTSNWIAGTDVGYTVPGSALTNGHDYILTVSVRDTGGLVGSSGPITFDTAWTPPTAPSFTIDTSMYAEDGYIEITWDDSAMDEDFASWAVVVKKVGGTLVGQESVILPTATSGTFQLPLIGAVDPYEVDVQQVVVRYGVLVWSEPDPETITVSTTYYWLVKLDYQSVPDVNDLIKLHNVIEDNPSEDQDYETHKLIGRGNKDDLGTHYGWSGALVCQLRDKPDLTAREQKEILVSARRTGVAYALRTPFGDIFIVNLGLLSMNRIPGVGVREFVDITIPYHEVAVGTFE